MKKMLLLTLTILALVSFSNNDKKTNNDVKKVEVHKMDIHHENEYDFEKFVGDVKNFHNKKGYKHSHLLVISNEKEALIRLDGKEYLLEKTDEENTYMLDKIVLVVNDKDANINLNGEKIEYFKLKKTSREYAKDEEHDHDNKHINHNELDFFKFRGLVYNYQSIENSKSKSELLVIANENEALVRKDGKEYRLKLVLSASGTKYEGREIEVILKGKHATVVIDKEEIDYIKINRASRNYAKIQK